MAALAETGTDPGSCGSVGLTPEAASLPRVIEITFRAMPINPFHRMARLPARFPARTLRRARTLLIPLAALAAVACTAPRAVLFTPEATPKGHFRAGWQMGINMPTQTSEALYGGLEGSAKRVWNQYQHDTVAITADSLNDLAKALVAYSLDPLSVPAGIQFRYGLWHRLDIGYRYDGGANAFDVRYQWLGPEAAKEPGWRGSLAFQYSSQDYSLPSVAYLDKLQELLRYEFTRKDFLFPLIVGRPLGKEGRIGSIGMGLAYDLSMVHWNSDVLNLVEKLDDGSTREFEPLQGEKTISAYGAFFNFRAGYKYVFLLGSFSLYWQDYGTYKLFGGKTVSLEGWTLMPTLGLEFRI